MKYKKKILCICAVLVVCSVCISCANQKKNEKTVNKSVVLNKGAIVQNENGHYVNLNYINHSYSLVDSKVVIASYDYISGNYIGQSLGKYISDFNGKTSKLDKIGANDSFFNISPKGKYVSFFRNKDGSEIKIIKLSNGEYININKKVSISGKYADWLNDNTLIYYGIRESDKKNGIFTYNVDTNQEKLFIGLEQGYIEFIKVLDNQVIYCQGFFDSDKKLIVSSLNGTELNIVSNEIHKLYDIQEINGVYFVLGSFKNTDEALFSLQNNVHKRLTYSFPKYVNMKKGLMKTEDGDILLIGCNNNEEDQQVYQCSKDGSISFVQQISNDITFVRKSTD